MFYRLAYRLGFTPWEKAAVHPPAVRHIEALFAHEEEGRDRPLGRALDIGCGRGHWSIVLAEHGWQVTGVDVVSSAIRTARKRANEAGIEVDFITADITRLRNTLTGTTFSLLWDFGTLHGLGREALKSAGQELTAVAERDAVLLTLVWSPGRRGPLPRGLTQAELEAAFPDWRIIDVADFDVEGLPRPLRGVGPRIYRLQH